MDACASQESAELKNDILHRQIVQACVTIFCAMVISGPILNRLAFGPPKSMRSATVVSVIPLYIAGAHHNRVNYFWLFTYFGK